MKSSSTEQTDLLQNAKSINSSLYKSRQTLHATVLQADEAVNSLARDGTLLNDSLHEHKTNLKSGLSRTKIGLNKIKSVEAKEKRNLILSLLFFTLVVVYIIAKRTRLLTLLTFGFKSALWTTQMMFSHQQKVSTPIANVVIAKPHEYEIRAENQSIIATSSQLEFERKRKAEEAERQRIATSLQLETERKRKAEEEAERQRIATSLQLEFERKLKAEEEEERQRIATSLQLETERKSKAEEEERQRIATSIQLETERKSKAEEEEEEEERQRIATSLQFETERKSKAEENALQNDSMRKQQQQQQRQDAEEEKKEIDIHQEDFQKSNTIIESTVTMIDDADNSHDEGDNNMNPIHFIAHEEL